MYDSKNLHSIKLKVECKSKSILERVVYSSLKYYFNSKRFSLLNSF